MTDTKPVTVPLGFLRSRASGKIVLLLFIITMSVYLVMLLITIPRVQHFAPNTALFDLSPTGYSHQQAMSLLESLGPEGRKVYLFPQLALDFVYPGLFAISYSLILVWVFSKQIRSNSKLFYLALLPAFAGLFDYIENILIIRMIMKFPAVTNELVSAASGFTLLKSAFTTASLFLLVLGFFIFLKRRMIPTTQVHNPSRKRPTKQSY